MNCAHATYHRRSAAGVLAPLALGCVFKRRCERQRVVVTSVPWSDSTKVPGASMYPQCSFNSLASSRRRGLVEAGPSYLLPFQFQGRVGALEWNAEFGRELGHRFEITAEIHGEGEFQADDDELIVNLGGRLRLTEGRTLLVSIGRSLNRRHGAAFDFVGYVGLQSTF